MTPERVALAERFAVRWGSFSDRQESRSIALLSVWKAEKTWRPDGGCSFATWAGYYCRRYLWTLRRSEARREAHLTHRFEVDWVGCAPEESDPFQAEALHSAIAKLPRCLREAVELVYLQGMTHADAAEQIGVGRMAVTARCERALKKLKRTLKASGVAPF